MTEPVSAGILQRIRRLTPCFGRLPGTWALVAISAVVGAATEPMIPALLKPLLDKGFQQGELAIWTVPASLLMLFGIRGLAGYFSLSWAGPVLKASLPGAYFGQKMLVFKRLHRTIA